MPVRFEAQTVDTARIIGLALTPVFLVSAIGVVLNVLANRVARLADRARKIEERAGPRSREELASLIGVADRTQLLYASIAATLFAALMAALIVLLLFANTVFETDLSTAIEVAFMVVAVALLASLLLFFAEVALAMSLLRRRRRELAAARAAAEADCTDRARLQAP